MQKAEVAGPPEALGQDVLQDQPEESGAAHRAHRHLAGLAVAVTKADLALVTGQDVLLLNDASIKIAAEIDQSLLASADAFAVDDPFPWVAGGYQLKFEVLPAPVMKGKAKLTIVDGGSTLNVDYEYETGNAGKLVFRR